MEISDFLSKETIIPKMESEDKEEALTELVDVLIEKTDEVGESDKDKIMDNLLERESLGSTGIGQGVGIPHGKTECVSELVAALGLSEEGVDFEALDGEKVRIIFLLLAPTGTTGPHLKALAHISRILRDRFVRERLLKCENSKQVLSVLSREDEKFTVE